MITLKNYEHIDSCDNMIIDQVYYMDKDKTYVFIISDKLNEYSEIVINYFRNIISKSIDKSIIPEGIVYIFDYENEFDEIPLLNLLQRRCISRPITSMSDSIAEEINKEEE